MFIDLLLAGHLELKMELIQNGAGNGPRFGEVPQLEIGPRREVQVLEIGPLEIGPLEIGSLEIGPLEIGPRREVQVLEIGTS